MGARKDAWFATSERFACRCDHRGSRFDAVLDVGREVAIEKQPLERSIRFEDEIGVQMADRRAVDGHTGFTGDPDLRSQIIGVIVPGLRRTFDLSHVPATEAIWLKDIDAHQNAIMLKGGFEDRILVTVLQQSLRRRQRSGQIGLSLHHDTARQERAGSRANLVPGSEPGFCALIVFSEFRAMNR
ncbi:hypothetical protein M527_23685 [Sphingobium indicum IP26]|uniref:Uncharacterized protein n=1 Tax=Sphingobium indicum F2 TaxID=1450518 RepID=A0A8E1C1U3_9SPHN|nr:hypothetical protein M527_23685 [Sphingobium indicum IP26]KER35454.1 hypothetical protein AL00_15925 [Sphingobium indicum F2]